MITASLLLLFAAVATPEEEDHLAASKATRLELLNEASAVKRGKQWPEALAAKANDGYRMATKRWLGCGYLKALDYYKLNEAAKDIAAVAVAECRAWRDENRAWYYVYFQARAVPLYSDEVAKTFAEFHDMQVLNVTGFIMQLRVSKEKSLKDAKAADGQEGGS